MADNVREFRTFRDGRGKCQAGRRPAFQPPEVISNPKKKLPNTDRCDQK